MSVIVIVSNHQESGDEIARKVAAHLEYTYISDALIEDTARKHGTSLKKLKRAMAGDRTLFNAITHDYEKSVVYIKASLAGLLAKDGIVIYGPAGCLVPASIGHVLRVGIVADPEYRVRYGVEREGLSAKEAEVRMAKRDEERTRWVSEQVGTTPWDRGLFDVRIPLPATSADEAVELICDAITRDALRMTDVTVKAAMDFMLATKVRLTLLEKGHYSSEVMADDGKVTVTQVSKPAPQGTLGRTVHALRQESQQDAAGPIARGVEGVKEVKVQLSAARGPVKTLLVDDEEEYVTTLSERLEMRDIAADVVYDGHQALAAVKEEEPAVMILDLKMPGINGLEVLRRVKADHPNIQVIVVTGHGSEDDERTARDLGAFDYLHKPVDISTLAEKINQASAASADAAAAAADAAANQAAPDTSSAASSDTSADSPTPPDDV
jgi:two-component system, OmpR family, response regulator CpxR